MSERRIRFGRPSRSLALLAVGAALASSSCGGNRNNHTSLVSCYEKPLPEREIKELPSPDMPKAPKIKLKLEESGVIEGNPVSLSRKLEHRVEDAIVKIRTPDGTGSGFIIKEGGEKLVVTAGHVAEDHDPEDILIEDKHGRETHATGGCYIFEEDGKFKDFGGDDAVDYDVAVLRLESQKIGSRALKLAKKYPVRGKWVIFENYQQNAPADSPISYPGIIATTRHSSLYLTAITGLNIVRNRSRQDDYRLMKGASGGAVVELSKGEVVAVSVAGPEDNKYDGCSNINTLYDIECPPKIHEGDETGFLPSNAMLTEVSVIKKAIKALDR